MNDNSQDILDWCFISNKIYDELKSFKVLKNNPVDSDHYPIEVVLDLDNKEDQTQAHINNDYKKRFNYNKANWVNFR